MIITSQSQAPSSSIASTAANVATLGISGAARSAFEAKAERTDPSTALTNMCLTGQVREVLERELKAAVPGTMVEDAPFKLRSGKQERQYTLVRMPGAEIVLLQIPGWILKDGNQINNLDLLLYALRGRTVRVFSPDLPGEPSSWFNGLKKNWEDDEKIYIDFISHSGIAELDQGEGDLWNVLKLDLKALSAPGQRKPDVAAVAAKEEGATQLRKIRIFLASSKELLEDRIAFDGYFRRLNDQLHEKGIYLDIIRWEHFLDAMSETRSQDEYNKAIRDADILVCLFFTKTGKFTGEEFDTAYNQFKAKGRPFIYTYFKDATIMTGSAKQEDLETLWAFKKKLQGLEHFYPEYSNIDNLLLRFREQLDILLAGKLRE